MKNSDKNILWRIDWFTVLLYVGLVIAGWINIFAAVYNEEAASILDVSQKYGKQMIWILAAFFLAASILIIDSKFYYSLSIPIYLFVIGLIVLTYFIAPNIKGAHAWIEIGSFSLQPSEFMKLAVSLVLARYLSGYGIKVTHIPTLFRAALIILFPVLLIILQNDTGSALVYGFFLLVFYRFGLSGWVLVASVYSIFLFSFSIIYNAYYVSIAALIIAYITLLYNIWAQRISNSTLLLISPLAFIIPWAARHFWWQQLPEYTPIVIGLALLLVPTIVWVYKRKIFAILLVYLFTVVSVGFSYSVDYIFYDVLGDHQQSRIRVFFGLESDPHGVEFNVIQSKIAIGSGDFLGKGFLQGTQTKNNFVPEQSTDFIFCTVGEEWGFVGAAVVIIAFVILMLRLVYLAEKQRSMFSKVYGYCVVAILFFHFVVNIGMTIGFMPVIGIPLPFFSYGGSSLWGFTMLLFIFLRLDTDRQLLFQ